MPTVRGFVQRIEIGRAGLATVTLVHDDASTAPYVVSDLDADPERFNERLSKLAVLRDAMDRAEPVEVEWSEGKAGREIDRAARITRDVLQAPARLETVTGLVLELTVLVQNRSTPTVETTDTAAVTLLTSALALRACVLHLQTPERLAADAQLALLRQAQDEGRAVRLLLDAGGGDVGLAGNPSVRDGSTNTVNVGEGAAARIVAVTLDAAAGDDDGSQATPIDGFVESLSLMRPPTTSGAAVGTFAHVRLTTAPPFTGAGNVVAMTAFTPEAVDLLTPKGSLAYDLFEAALRDGLRVRTRASFVGGRSDPRAPRNADDAKSGEGSGGAGRVGVASAVELLAPLASASRPVWVAVERRQLDLGPEGDRCTLGSPTSDMTPRSIRDLRLPYPARWCGHGCFNAGVYRVQLGLDSACTLTVDGRDVCLHEGDDGVRIGHACLDAGCHEVCVSIEAWTCESDFVMDVYRLR